MSAYALELDDTRPRRDFLRMERGGERIERGRRIRVFWSEEGRCFELDARGHHWREVPGIGQRPPFELGGHSAPSPSRLLLAPR